LAVEWWAIEIDMNPWSEPQSSEHWPLIIPVRFEVQDMLEIRPGQTSKRTRRWGQAREWITSVAVPVNERWVERQRRVQQRWIAQTCPGDSDDDVVRSRDEESQYHWSPRMSSQVLLVLVSVTLEINA
jgi:hypothetical protein